MRYWCCQDEGERPSAGSTGSFLFAGSSRDMPASGLLTGFGERVRGRSGITEMLVDLVAWQGSEMQLFGTSLWWWLSPDPAVQNHRSHEFHEL